MEIDSHIYQIIINKYFLLYLPFRFHIINVIRI